MSNYETDLRYLTELEELLEEEIYERSRQSLYEYFKHSWSCVDPAILNDSWYIECICEHLEAAARREIRRLCICVPPRTSKPLDANTTYVLLPNNESKLLADIVPGDYVINSKGEPDLVLEVFDQGELDCLQITTNRGTTVNSAYDHPFLTVRNGVTNFVEAQNLKVRDRIKTLTGNQIVTKLPYVGKKSCKCIRVQNDSTFIANGLIVHNSSIASVAFPTWLWGPAGSPDEKFITISHSAKLASDLSVKARNLITHPWYSKKWLGSVYSIASDSNTKLRIDTDKNGYRIAATPTTNIIGLGYTIAIVDDALDGTQADSKLAKKKVNDTFFDGVLINRANDPSSDVIIIVQQRLAEDDLVGHVTAKERADGYFLLNLPAEYDPKRTFISPIGYNDRRTTPGESLNPERLTPAFLAEQKKNPYRYAALYQQQPAPTDGGVVKKDWFKTYYEVPKLDILIGTCDFTFGDDGTSYNVIHVWGKRDERIYLIDEFRGKWDILKQIENLTSVMNTYKNLSTVLIEDRANGRAVVDMLKRTFTNLEPIKPSITGTRSVDKMTRLQSVIPDIQKEILYIPSEKLYQKEWAIEFVAELCLFPKARHDDRVDSTVMAMNWFATKGRHVRINAEQINMPLKPIPGSRSILKQSFDSDISRKTVRNLFN